MSGYLSKIGPMLRASDWFLSSPGIVRYVVGLLPGILAKPVHDFTVNNTQWNLTSEWQKYAWSIWKYVCISVSRGLWLVVSPAVQQWAGIGLESVRCWEHRTGSCPVLALCDVSSVYYHVLGPIRFMSLLWITLREIWVKNDIKMHEVLKNMSVFLYLGASNW